MEPSSRVVNVDIHGQRYAIKSTLDPAYVAELAAFVDARMQLAAREMPAGDTLKVHVKVIEGNRSRIQVFQGVCIRIHGSGIGRSFTVRKVSFGVGVERTFPLHTPIIEKIEVATRGDVRRAKLYYLRTLRGKAAKIKEKRED